MSADEINTIATITLGQAENHLWYKYRFGRITGSNMFEVLQKVSDTDSVKPKHATVLSRILGTGKSFSTKATCYGSKMEVNTCALALHSLREEHCNLKMLEAGFYICE